MNPNTYKFLLSIISGFITALIFAGIFVLIPDPSFNEYKSVEFQNEYYKSHIPKDTLSINQQKDSIFLVNQLNIESSSRFKKNKEYSSKKTFILEALYHEFSVLLFLLFSTLFFFIYDRPEFRDYFPKTDSQKESGIHAKLNYQVIADRQTRKLTMLMIFIILFSVIFIFTIFRFSSEIDKIIHTDDIIAYDLWITKLETHIGQNTDFIEENTKMFWMVYFIRFILVRTLIAFIVGVIITFLIRLYNQTRMDRDLIIQKEEALSALHYIARGEWRYEYDNNGELLFEGNSNAQHKVLKEASYYNLPDDDKRHYKPKELHNLRLINSTKDSRITTKELLGLIPVSELFRTASLNKKRGRNKKIDEELVYGTNQAKESLREFIAELQKSTTLVRNMNDIDPSKRNMSGEEDSEDNNVHDDHDG